MGGCMSFSSSAPSKPVPTAKLILEDGGLREFTEPVKVEGVVAESPGFFVCDADSMSIEEHLCPLPADEKLQLEEIYFLMPVRKLRYSLRASEMAALAVKASAAMKRSGHIKSRVKIRPLTENNLDLHRVSRRSFLAHGGTPDFVGQVSQSSILWDAENGGGRIERTAARRRMLTCKKTLWESKLNPIQESFDY